MASATFPLYDQILNGRLEQILRRYRVEEELSLRKIADRLRSDHGLSVSHALVDSWCVELKLPTPVRFRKREKAA